MPICDECGQEFDDLMLDGEWLDEEGDDPAPYYSNFKRCLCPECALNAYRSEDISEYSKTCERCGCEFHLLTAKSQFLSFAHGSLDPESWYYDGNDEILCESCLSDAYFEACKDENI